MALWFFNIKLKMQAEQHQKMDERSFLISLLVNQVVECEY